ncbi:MAG: hypothetical protein M3R00_00995 [Pseudomonadota bacterium]|nr:hypothetical protein [Pseudomonadota bacterium]
MNILLTNDDSDATNGIRIIQQKLRSAGHNVTIVAPKFNNSGAGAGFDLSRPRIKLAKVSTNPDIYNVASVCPTATELPTGCAAGTELGPASPSVALQIGYTLLGSQNIDLVISGPNQGVNPGQTPVFSGTVGAILFAISTIHPNGPKPGIAISSNIDKSDLARLRQMGDFMVSLVAYLEKNVNVDKRLLPLGVGLNINYPDLASKEIKGVRISNQGNLLRTISQPPAQQGKTYTFSYTSKEGIFYNPAKFVPMKTAIKTRNNSDDDFLAAGYITIVPMEVDITAKSSLFSEIQRRLKSFHK